MGTNSARRLRLAAWVAAAMGLAFGAVSAYYEREFSQVHRGLGADELTGIPIGFAMYFLALAATFAAASYAIGSGRGQTGARFSVAGLISLALYLVISPWFGRLTDNPWIAENGTLFFAALVVSLPVALGIGIAGTLGLLRPTGAASAGRPAHA